MKQHARQTGLAGGANLGLQQNRGLAAALKEAAARQQYADCQGEKVADGYAENVAVRELTPIEMVERAAAEVGNVSARLQQLADKLVGERPPAGGDASSRPSRPGQFGNIADRADNIAYAVQSIHESLHRIEQQLP